MGVSSKGDRKVGARLSGDRIMGDRMSARVPRIKGGGVMGECKILRWIIVGTLVEG